MSACTDEPTTPDADAPVTDVAPGPRAHRLTRAQLARTTRSLLGVRPDVERWMPADPSTSGFDNTDAGLFLDPDFLSRWRAAVRQAIAGAVRGDTLAAWTPEELYEIQQFQFRSGAYGEVPEALIPNIHPNGGALTQGGPVELAFFAPEAGLYTLTMELDAEVPEEDRAQSWILGGQPSPVTPEGLQLTASVLLDAPGRYGVELELSELAVHGITITGGSSPPSSLVTCEPTEASCARAILAPFVRTAWRREVADAEIDSLVDIVRASEAIGTPPREALGDALEAILLSPWFLFRVEPEALDASAVASRLAFFLWAEGPDEELLAMDGADAIASQVDRMLASPRMSGFVEDFGGQWVGLHTLDTHQPDPEAFPLFDASLRHAMRAETEVLLGRWAAGELTLQELFTTPTSTVEEPLASLYGLPAGTDVDVSTVGRLGLLGHASVLTANSKPTRTSIVDRGAWVWHALLCEDLDDPPVGVQSNITPDDPQGDIAARAANPGCSGCHDVIDPIGVSLENFDAIGAPRTTYSTGAAVDPRGQFPDGTRVEGLPDLAGVLSTDPRLPRCLTTKVFTWALGHPVPAQAPAVDEALAAFEAGEWRLPALLKAVATSPLFLSNEEGL